jgi:Fic family protein
MYTAFLWRNLAPPNKLSKGLYQLMQLRRKEILMCTISQASDLIEFERKDSEQHCHAMKVAVEWGEQGKIPDLYDIKELHKMLFPYGGDFRSCYAMIRGSNHQPPAPQFVWMMMRAYADNAVWMLEQANGTGYSVLAELHLEFTKIHPFSDGNGRVGRLLLNNYATNLGLPYIKLTPEVRDQYLDYLQAEDIESLAQLFKECSIS